MKNIFTFLALLGFLAIPYNLDAQQKSEDDENGRPLVDNLAGVVKDAIQQAIDDVGNDDCSDEEHGLSSSSNSDGSIADNLGGQNSYTTIDDNRNVTDETSGSRFAVTQEELLAFEMFPNPAKADLNVALASDLNHEVRVYTILGQEVLMASSNGETLLKLDVSGLQTGVYLIQVANEFEMITRKIKIE